MLRKQKNLEINFSYFVTPAILQCLKIAHPFLAKFFSLQPLASYWFFNIFLNDLFLFVENSDLSNYADDNMLCSSGNDLEKAKQTLRQDFEIVAKLFYENYMVLNLGKCHFMYLGQNAVNETFFYDNTEMKNSKE